MARKGIVHLQSGKTLPLGFITYNYNEVVVNIRGVGVVGAVDKNDFVIPWKSVEYIELK